MFLRPTILVLISLFFGITVCSQQVDWLTDPEQAQKLARENGKPLLIDFSASWCSPCKSMEKNFWPKTEVIELSKKFVCVKVNFDRYKSFAAKYGVRGIPNVVFTDPWGRGLTFQLGFGSVTEGEILDKIRFIPADFSPVRDAGNVLEDDNKDLDALHKMADFYQERKLYWQGTDFLKRIIKLELDTTKRENALVNLGFNYIRLGELDNAIDRFEKLEKDFPNSGEHDLFLYGRMYASLKKNKLQNAEKIFAELKSRFPNSKLVSMAEKNLQDAKTRKLIN